MINKSCIGLLIVTFIFIMLNNQLREDFYGIADLISELGKGIDNVKKDITKVLDKIPPGTPLGDAPLSKSSESDPSDS